MKAVLIAMLALLVSCSVDTFVVNETETSPEQEKSEPVFVEETSDDTQDGCGRVQGYPMPVPSGGQDVIEIPLECNLDLMPDEGYPPPDSYKEQYTEQVLPVDDLNQVSIEHDSM